MKKTDTTANSPLQALIINSHILVQAGLGALIREIDPEAGVNLSDNSLDALKDIDQGTHYDLILLDIDMPDMDGLELLRKISAQTSTQTTAILVISGATDPERVAQAKSLGVKYFLPKKMPSTTIAQNIRSALKHDGPPPPNSGNLAKITQTNLQLNKRQLQILQYLAQGLSNKEISQTIFLSEGTIKNHITQILHSLGVSNRTQAIIKAEKLHLIKR